MLHARFFAPGLDGAGSRAPLPPDEAEHLTRVLRLGVDDRVAAFNGRGGQWMARVASVGRAAVIVEALEALEAAPEPSVRLAVAQAVLKGDKMDQVVRDAVMLGAASLVPLVSERTDVHASALDRGRRVERWTRVAVASAKQCGRAVVPCIERPQPLEQYLAGERAEARLMLVEPEAAPAEGASNDWRRPAPRSAALLVGPEGGWTAREVASAERSGFRPLTLGRLTLRAETAPVAALAILRFAWGDL